MKKVILKNYGPVFLGVLLTGMVGLGVNHFIQSQIASRQEHFELYKNKLASAEKILEEVINLINSRMFSLQRVVWDYKNAEKEDVSKDWSDYRRQVQRWNFNDAAYRMRLSIYFGSDVAAKFGPDKDAVSIYKYFWGAHRRVLSWKSCLRKACQFGRTGEEVCRTNQCNKQKSNSEKSLSQLRGAVDQYMGRLYFEYKNRYLKIK